MAEFVRLLEEIGPNINEIARRTGVYKETARYWYKKKIQGRGFAVQASINHGRLGLSRLLIIAKINRAYVGRYRQVLAEMSDNCFVTYYSRTIGEDSVLVMAAVPREHLEAFKRLIYELRNRLHFFTKVEILSFDWFRRLPMRAKFYDFKEDRWDFDWTALEPIQREGTLTTHPTRTKFDKTDLQVLGLLQVSADKSVAEIARDMHFTYKKALRHYKHVLEAGLISRYTVFWTRTGVKKKEGRPGVVRHRYLWVGLVVRGTSGEDSAELMESLERLPFTWSEAAGDNFFIDMAVPLELSNEVLKYIREALVNFEGRANVYLGDENESAGFMLSSEPYDSRQKQWVFDPKAILDKFGGTIAQLEVKSR